MTVNTIENAEHYNYGISRILLDNGRIVLIKTNGDMSRNAINTWASLIILTIQDWDKEKTLAVLHDLTHPSQGLTPYARERTTELLKYIPNTLQTYSAVVLPPTFMNRIINMFIRTPIFRHPCHEIQVFRDTESGLAWLRKKLAEDS
jgi:hypothetical protein